MPNSAMSAGPEAGPEQTQSSAPPQHIAGPWSFILEYARVPDGLSGNDRAHWGTKAASTKAVRQLAYMRATSLVNRRRMPARLEKIRVQLTWYVRDDKRTRDEENLVPMLKAICDGLADRSEWSGHKSAHLVPDDSPEFMEKPMPRIVKIRDKGVRPHFEVTITNVGGIA